MVKKFFIPLVLLLFSLPSLASTGCSGKMWNPLELDFTNMGPIRVNFLGMKIDFGPQSAMPSPPEHTPVLCNCPDGLDGTIGPTGLGITYWLPSYIVDVAKTPGCLSFLGGIQVMEKFRSLGGTENQHMPRSENFITNQNRQRHFAHADISSMIGNGFFEKCGSTVKGINIAFMTEVCFPCQSDIWSMLLVPVGQVLANNPMLSTLACGAARVAAMVGYPPMDYVCNISGTRFPLSQTTPMGASSAQEINTDQIAKHFTLAHLTGGGLRTIGSDTFCRPQATFVWNPEQHRFQFMFPLNRPTMTHLQVNKLFFAKGSNGQNALKSPGELQNPDFDKPETSATDSSLSAGIENLARSMMNVAAPLNYPRSEHAYLQIWEAKSCCQPTVTYRLLAEMGASQFITNPRVKELMDRYQEIKSIMATLQTIDSIGSLVALANGAAAGAGTAGVAATTVGGALSPDQAASGIAKSFESNSGVLTAQTRVQLPAMQLASAFNFSAKL